MKHERLVAQTFGGDKASGLQGRTHGRGIQQTGHVTCSQHIHLDIDFAFATRFAVPAQMSQHAGHYRNTCGRIAHRIAYEEHAVKTK